MRRAGTVVSKCAALSLLVLMLGALYLGTVEPLLSRYQQTEVVLQETRSTTARFLMAAREYSATQEKAAQVDNDRSFERAYFVVPRLPLAVAELQGLVKRVVEESSGDLLSTQEVVARSNELHPRVSVRVRMETTLEGLREVFYRLEGGEPYLFVDNLSIQPKATARSRHREADTAPAAQVLLVQFDVYGYAWVQGA